MSAAIGFRVGVRLLVLGTLMLGWEAFGVSAPLTLESKALRFTLWPDTGAYELLDRKTGVVWQSNPWRKRFGEVLVVMRGVRHTVDLGACEGTRSGSVMRLLFKPVAGRPEVTLRVEVRLLRDGQTLEFVSEPSAGPDWQNLRLLDEGLVVTEADRGGVLVPVREGMLVPADSGVAFQHRFGTYEYEGCHLEMAGVLKRGAALLVTWHDPHTVLAVTSRVPPEVPGLGRQAVSCSLDFRRTGRGFRLQVLGAGDAVAVARAYREVAEERGWLVTWREKVRENRARERLLGAISYKLWSMLDRRMDEASKVQQSVRVNWTFEEAAQVAEHLRYDLKLDRVLFTLGGWIHRGYDNQHPDVLPAAPECGGDAGLAEAARRIRACGYLLALHDNYQDIYRDSPSWSEDLIMRKADGSLAVGGSWAGGRAYLTCSPRALELARRPQNLPAVRDLTRADAYFIDTTYAAGLQDCWDKNHPLTRWQDMKYKQELSDYARSMFGMFGSECGREWGIPHSDFFEGFTGVAGRRYHDAGLEKKLGAVRVPLFEMVYRDTMALHGKYGYDMHESADYVLDHVSVGRPLHHHDLPARLYWKQNRVDPSVLALGVKGVEVKSAGPGRVALEYAWEVEKAPTNEWQVFVHFVDAQGKVRFQNDHRPGVSVASWRPGVHREAPAAVRLPADAEGTFEVKVGLFGVPGGQRALLKGNHDGQRAYSVGRLKVQGGQATFEPAPPTPDKLRGDRAVFVRGDQGWGEELHPVDRFVKNSYEILSPLHELTATVLMTQHEFVTANREVVRTVFGEGKGATEVVVNYGATEVTRRSRWGGEVVLPRHGFLVEGPSFVAFHARQWNGRTYESPTLFTLRSLDGRPLDRSRQVRVYHAFGDPRIDWHGRVQEVRTEAVLEPGTGAAGLP